jgi:hypothetical protein
MHCRRQFSARLVGEIVVLHDARPTIFSFEWRKPALYDSGRRRSSLFRTKVSSRGNCRHARSAGSLLPHSLNKYHCAFQLAPPNTAGTLTPCLLAVLHPTPPPTPNKACLCLLSSRCLYHQSLRRLQSFATEQNHADRQHGIFAAS